MSRFINKKLIAVMSAAMLMTAFTPYTAMAMPTGGSAVVDGILVRATAVNGEPVGSLTQGQNVSVIDEASASDGKTWYQITYKVNDVEIKGWVRSDLLNATGEAEPEKPQIETVDVEFTFAENTYNPVAKLDEAEMPQGFSLSAITINETEVPAFVSADGQIQVIKLLNKENSEDDGLFMYNKVDGSISPFICLNMGTGYVILLNAPEGITVSETYMPVEAYFGNASLNAYQVVHADFTDEAADTTGMYIIYGMDETGANGWYSYDSELKSLQRSILNMNYEVVEVVEEPVVEEPEDTASDKMDEYVTMMFAGLTAVCGLLFILFVVVAIRFKLAKKRYNNLKETAKRKYGKTKEEEAADVADTVKKKYDVEFLGEDELLAHKEAPAKQETVEEEAAQQTEEADEVIMLDSEIIEEGIAEANADAQPEQAAEETVTPVVGGMQELKLSDNEADDEPEFFDEEAEEEIEINLEK